MTTIIVICTISREDDTHPILAEDEGKNGLLVLPKRHWILYYYNTMYTFSLGNFMSNYSRPHYKYHFTSPSISRPLYNGV